MSDFREFLANITRPIRRVGITGSRTWTWESDVHEGLSLVRRYVDGIDVGYDVPLTLVHGAAGRGVDRIGRDYAAAGGWDIEPHPADWISNGRAAGLMRNVEMVREGADVWLAWIHNGSRGATHCADYAEKCGIPTWRWTR
jgi:hypothetical protein